MGTFAERRDRPWVAHPLYAACALLLILVLELLALDGRAFQYLGFSLHPFQSIAVSDPLLLDTITAMTINGLLFYLLADVLHRRGSEDTGIAVRILFAISPFAVLQPLGYLVRSGDYSPRYDWVYLACAIAIVLLSEKRQRRAFFYAGILNTGAALFLIADHRHWFDRPAWSISVIAAGLAALAIGFELDRRLRRGPRRKEKIDILAPMEDDHARFY